MNINLFSSNLSKNEDKALKSYIRNTFGFSPKKLLIYKKALIHKSIPSENGKNENNERLEFLGDAVLSVIIADFLYKKYPLANEGFLTELRSRVLNGNHLNKLSRKIGLDTLIKTNDRNFKVCESILGNALEAFIGALYMDKGYNFTRKIFIEKIINIHVDIDMLARVNSNYKGKILAWSQKLKHKIEYKIANEIIYNKRKQYVIQLFVDNEFVAEGCDYNIKGAEQNAAFFACEKLEL
ncbi:MAG: ribonuclease III [Bacteroidales bacterium]|nr:ribonuclease III [Bacteroidales bacterium]